MARPRGLIGNTALQGIKRSFSIQSIPCFGRAVGVEVVNDGELEVVGGPISVEAIAFTGAIVADTVPVAFVQGVTT